MFICPAGFHNAWNNHNLTVAEVFYRTNHIFTLTEVWRYYFQSQKVLKTFFLHTSSSTVQFGFKPRMPLPYLGPDAERHQTLFVAEKKETCATLSKAVNVLSHNSQARDLGVCLCGKALAGHGGTSIISACLPGVACVEITASINKQSPSVEIFIQTELRWTVWALFLHLKGLFRKPYMGKSTPWNQWGATHWLSAECYRGPLIYCRYGAETA